MFHQAGDRTRVSAGQHPPTRRRGLIDLAVACLLLLWATERPVLAYIDPGSGALLLQAILAGFFGAIFYFRKFLGRFWFKRKDTNSETRLDSE